MRINFKAATFAIFAIFIVSQSMPFSALAQSLEEFSAHVDRAIQLNNEGKYSEAIAEAEKALAVAEQHLGPDHEGTLTVVDMLGFLYSKNTQFREADRFYTRVLEARRRLSKDHPDTLTTLKLICGRHIVDARWSEAEPICREAFDGRRRVLGDEHTDTLSIENELGLALHNLGRYAEAGRHLKHSAETLERSKGIDDRLGQSALGNLAGHYNDIGLHGDAERILIRVLEAREDLHGKGHLETLTTANTLAVVYSAQGRYQEAVALLETVWETRKRVLGLEHFDTLSAANNLAANYSDLERYEDAETLYKSVLEISERLRHPDHPDIINGLNNLGVLYDEMGRDQEAEPLLRRAAEAAERTLGNHPLTSTVLGNLAALYFEARDWKRASDLWRRCTAILAVMTRRNATAANQAPTGKIVSEAEGAYRQFLGLVKAIYRDKPDEASARETFESVQIWAPFVVVGEGAHYGE